MVVSRRPCAVVSGYVPIHGFGVRQRASIPSLGSGARLQGGGGKGVERARWQDRPMLACTMKTVLAGPSKISKMAYKEWSKVQ